jgi:orotidine-5'-phosphate decarboxylase
VLPSWQLLLFMTPEALSSEILSPSSPDFIAKLENRWSDGNFVSVGLDSDYDLIPGFLKDSTPTTSLSGALRNTHVEEVMFRFNQEIIDATYDLACAYKPNTAFYEAQGQQGIVALKRTIEYINNTFPNIPVILDAKRGDIGNTNNGYVRAAFDDLGADAVTVHPYLGREAMKPFLGRSDKGIIVLVRTSNPGAGEFQDLPVGERGEPLYRVIARNVAESWNENGNCAVVVGATYPRELAEVRAVVGDMPILIPGIGAQGGEIEATVTAGKDSRNEGMIINSSRGIIFASNDRDFALAAREVTQQLTDEINRYR